MWMCPAMTIWTKLALVERCPQAMLRQATLPMVLTLVAWPRQLGTLALPVPLRELLFLQGMPQMVAVFQLCRLREWLLRATLVKVRDPRVLVLLQLLLKLRRLRSPLQSGSGVEPAQEHGDPGLKM